MEKEISIAEFMDDLKPGCEMWRVICELEELSESPEILYRPYCSLSPGERTKIGFDPIKEHDRCLSARSFIGAKTKKMQSRVKQMEKRIAREIEDKEGLCEVAIGLIISYVGQEVTGLKGNITNYCKEHNLDKSLFCAILRQLDFERDQFLKKIENYSEGQKKKY